MKASDGVLISESSGKLAREDLYSNSVSCVQVDGHMSDWFDIMAGVRQGCVVAPDMFLEPTDWIMECTTHRGYVGLTLGKGFYLQIWTLLMTWLSCLRCSKSLFLLLKSYMKSSQTWAWKLIGSKPRSRPPVM